MDEFHVKVICRNRVGDGILRQDLRLFDRIARYVSTAYKKTLTVS